MEFFYIFFIYIWLDFYGVTFKSIVMKRNLSGAILFGLLTQSTIHIDKGLIKDVVKQFDQEKRKKVNAIDKHLPSV